MKGSSIHRVLMTVASLSVADANAALLLSTNLEGWQTDIQTLFSNRLNQQLFETNYSNISAISSQSFSALPDPSAPNYASNRMNWNFNGNNVDLGRTAVFNSEKTGVDWSFTITALETDTVSASGSHYHGTTYSPGDMAQAHVIYNDRPDRSKFEQVDAFTDVLSIGKHKGYDTDEVADGDPYNWDNDDFRVDITSGTALYAFAFEIVNNKKYVDTTIDPANPDPSDGGVYSYGRESVSVTDASGNTQIIRDATGELPLIPGYYNDPDTTEDEGRYADNFADVRFIGIVSETPFISFRFDEDSRADDIGIRSLRFAGVTPVPVPAAFWLFASGILLILRQRRI